MVVRNNRAISRWIPAWKSNIVLFFWGYHCAFSLPQATSLTLIAVFAFSLSSLNLQTSSDPSISAQNSRDRASNMQICHASAFQFFQAATINDIITTHLQFQFIYFHPIFSCFSLKKVTENRKTKMMSQSGNWGRCLARNLLWLYFWWYWI